MDYQHILQQLIKDGETLVVPDAYDAVSARLIQRAGFKAVQCSGYSISISKAYPDERFVTLGENLSRTREIAAAVTLPVMADGEDGYGQEEVFRINLRRFMQTGIAGINIEDQNLWDAYSPDKIVPVEVMLDKIKSVTGLKHELRMPDFLLNARTDALRTTDSREAALKLAIQRANQYLQAGADMAFISGVRTKEEVRLLKGEVQGPLSIAAGLPYNIAAFSINDCREIGIARLSLPSILILSSLKAVHRTLQAIAQTGSFESICSGDHLFDQTTLSEMLENKEAGL